VNLDELSQAYADGLFKKWLKASVCTYITTAWHYFSANQIPSGRRENICDKRVEFFFVGWQNIYIHLFQSWTAGSRALELLTGDWYSRLMRTTR